ncbi:glycosyltransferase [candidate division KSB1 bacterium]|nr:glycosyltransferase [candidate division KSB1 bacterium]
MILVSLILVFVLIYSVIFSYLNSGLKKLIPCDSTRTPPVSVIVAARNEEQNIRRCVTAVLNQKYPPNSYELIVVDDNSTDQTFSILKEIAKENPNLKIVRVAGAQSEQSNGSKKNALSAGIDNARHDLLLFTDADCIPPRQWIRTTVSCFKDDVGLIAGFSPLIDQGNSILGKLVQCDSLMAASLAAAGISRNFPITCTGRNLAYRKTVFKEVGGFSEIIRSLSGDDDLLLHLIHRQTDWKIKYNININSSVPSVQESQVSRILSQKQRHISAGKYFPLSVKLFYALLHLTNFGCYLFLIISMITATYQITALLLLFIKIIFGYIFLRTGARKFEMTHLLKYNLLWEIYFLFYNLLGGPRAFFGKIQWAKT